MENNLQTQKAGDGAQQTQFKDCVFNMGLSETQVDERVVSVFNELIPKTLEAYTQDAYATANQRIRKLEELVMPRLAEIDGALEHFADPAFQIVLRKAQQSAAATEREDDYEMLSELLTCHVQQVEDRKNRVAVSKAIDIINQIDADALCALTVSDFINYWRPVEMHCHEGLNLEEKSLRDACYTELPTGSFWVEHLDMLGAVRITSSSNRRKLFDLEKQKMNGYVCIGIQKGSNEYNQACDILNKIDFDKSYWLQENELLKGYMRLPISNNFEIKRMNLIPDDQIPSSSDKGIRKATDMEVQALTSVWNLYRNDKILQKEVEENFRTQWNQHGFLCEIEHWWDNMYDPFHITEAGRLVAHVNAHRLNLI